jgi:hypothetical protein
MIQGMLLNRIFAPGAYASPANGSQYFLVAFRFWEQHGRVR